MSSELPLAEEVETLTLVQSRKDLREEQEGKGTGPAELELSRNTLGGAFACVLLLSPYHVPIRSFPNKFLPLSNYNCM